MYVWCDVLSMHPYMHSKCTQYMCIYMYKFNVGVVNGRNFATCVTSEAWHKDGTQWTLEIDTWVCMWSYCAFKMSAQIYQGDQCAWNEYLNPPARPMRFRSVCSGVRRRLLCARRDASALKVTAQECLSWTKQNSVLLYSAYVCFVHEHARVHMSEYILNSN